MKSTGGETEPVSRSRTALVVTSAAGLVARRGALRESPPARALPGMDLPEDPLEAPGVGVQLDEPLMTGDDVACLLRVPRSSVYDYARRTHHPLPSLVVGRNRRFYRSDVEAWLADIRSA